MKNGHPRLNTFRTVAERPGKPKPGTWTKVVCHQFDEDGNRLKEPAILTAFGGTDGGAKEAKRLADLLNLAYDNFYAGQEVG